MADDPNLSTAQNNSLGLLSQWLGSFNLGSLQDTVKQWIINGYSDDRIKLELQNTDVFKQEFPEYEARIKANLTPMTPAEILSYRQTATKLMKDAGMPAGFYDQKDDFVQLVTSDLSPNELNERIRNGYTRVQQAPQEVKDTFAEYFGAQGDNYLAAFFLDPTKSVDVIQRDLTQAEIGGAAYQYGFGMTKEQADRYAQQGITGAQARQVLGQAAQLQPLDEETINETNDITRSDIAEAALTGGEAQKRLSRRQQERSAAFGGGGGGAGQGRQGFGLGSSNG